MKSKVTYSTFATILTIVVYVGYGGLLVVCLANALERPAFFCLMALYVILVIASLLFGAVFIKADSKSIVLGSPLRNKKIPMSDVESVQLFQPTMGAIRVYASGGFMGYWGVFREGDIGKYTGFYGKASDCFLVCLKNGKKYVLGCSQPDKMVAYIKSQI